MNKQQNQDAEVIKTMLIPLWARAVEQTKKAPIIIDKFAQPTLEKLGYGLDYLDTKKQLFSQVGCCIRGQWIDKEVRKFASKHPLIQVIQLGAGLDARYQRLQDIENLERWYDLDLPEALVIRSSLIPKGEKVTELSISLFETEWMDLLAQNKLPTLIIIEGVLMYFTQEQITKLLDDIYKRLPKAKFLIDAIGYKLVGNAKHHDALSTQNKLEFTWGCKSHNDIKSLHYKVKLEKYRYMNKVKEAKKAPFMMRLIGKLPFINKFYMQRLIRFSFRQS